MALLRETKYELVEANGDATPRDRCTRCNEARLIITENCLAEPIASTADRLGTPFSSRVRRKKRRRKKKRR